MNTGNEHETPELSRIKARLDTYLSGLSSTNVDARLRLEVTEQNIVFSCLGAEHFSLLRLDPLNKFIYGELEQCLPAVTDEATLYLSEWLFQAIRNGHRAGQVTFEGIEELELRLTLSGSMAGLRPSMYQWVTVPLRLIISKETLVALIAAGLGGIVGSTLAPDPSVHAFLTGAATAELALIINYLAQIPDNERIVEEHEQLEERMQSVEKSVQSQLLKLGCIEELLRTSIGELHDLEGRRYTVEVGILLALQQAPNCVDGISSLLGAVGPSVIESCLESLIECGLVQEDGGSYRLIDVDPRLIRERLVLAECEKAVLDGNERRICLQRVAFISKVYKMDLAGRNKKGARVRVDAPADMLQTKRKWLPISDIIYIGSSEHVNYNILGFGTLQLSI